MSLHQKPPCNTSFLSRTVNDWLEHLEMLWGGFDYKQRVRVYYEEIQGLHREEAILFVAEMENEKLRNASSNALTCSSLREHCGDDRRKITRDAETARGKTNYLRPHICPRRE